MRACAACLLMLQRRYPPSLLRIISNYKLLHGGGLLDFFDTDIVWRHKCVEGWEGGSSARGMLRACELCDACAAGTLQPSFSTSTLPLTTRACAAAPTFSCPRRNKRWKCLQPSSLLRCCPAAAAHSFYMQRRLRASALSGLHSNATPSRIALACADDACPSASAATARCMQ